MNNRIVLKIGSAILVEDNQINFYRIESIAKLIYDLREIYDVVLVSSGAVASGYTKLHLDKKVLENKQALAAIGQPLLMQKYAEIFAKYNIVTAQMLLSWHDFDSRKHTKNAKNTMNVLLQNKILPIINENDVTAIGELLKLGFGDNDQLSAYVTHYFDASLLVILSDISGYYDSNPKHNANARMYKVINEISQDELESEATPNNAFATGGIVTKLKAANFLLENNREMFLSSGDDLDVLREFLLNNNHVNGTLFKRK